MFSLIRSMLTAAEKLKEEKKAESKNNSSPEKLYSHLLKQMQEYVTVLPMLILAEEKDSIAGALANEMVEHPYQPSFNQVLATFPLPAIEAYDVSMEKDLLDRVEKIFNKYFEYQDIKANKEIFHFAEMRNKLASTLDFVGVINKTKDASKKFLQDLKTNPQIFNKFLREHVADFVAGIYEQKKNEQRNKKMKEVAEKDLQLDLATQLKEAFDSPDCDAFYCAMGDSSIKTLEYANAMIKLSSFEEHDEEKARMNEALQTQIEGLKLLIQNPSTNTSKLISSNYGKANPLIQFQMEQNVKSMQLTM